MKVAAVGAKSDCFVALRQAVQVGQVPPEVAALAAEDLELDPGDVGALATMQVGSGMAMADAMAIPASSPITPVLAWAARSRTQVAEKRLRDAVERAHSAGRGIEYLDRELRAVVDEPDFDQAKADALSQRFDSQHAQWLDEVAQVGEAKRQRQQLISLTTWLDLQVRLAREFSNSR